MSEVNPNVAAAIYDWAAAHNTSVYSVIADPKTMMAAITSKQLSRHFPGESNKTVREVSVDATKLAEQIAESIDMGEAVWNTRNPSAAPRKVPGKPQTAGGRQTSASSQLAAFVGDIALAPVNPQSLRSPGTSARGSFESAMVSREGDQTLVRLGAQGPSFEVAHNAISGMPRGPVDLFDASFKSYASPKNGVAGAVTIRAWGS